MPPISLALLRTKVQPHSLELRKLHLNKLFPRAKEWSTSTPCTQATKQVPFLYIKAYMLHSHTLNTLRVYIQAQHMSNNLVKPIAHMPTQKHKYKEVTSNMIS